MYRITDKTPVVVIDAAGTRIPAEISGMAMATETVRVRILAAARAGSGAVYPAGRIFGLHNTDFLASWGPRASLFGMSFIFGDAIGPVEATKERVA